MTHEKQKGSTLLLLVAQFFFFWKFVFCQSSFYQQILLLLWLNKVTFRRMGEGLHDFMLNASFALPHAGEHARDQAHAYADPCHHERQQHHASVRVSCRREGGARDQARACALSSRVLQQQQG